MRRVHFGSGSIFLTGDAVAAVLMEYVRAVAGTGRTELIAVPVVTAHRGSGTVTLLVTQASQISAEPAEDGGRELRDDLFVERLRGMTRDLLEAHVWTGEGSEESSGRGR